MPAELFELTLTTLTYGGDALGRLDDPQPGTRGRAVFVPFGLPGERVRVRLTEQKRGFARGELVEVLDASPDRISPRCKHYFIPRGADEGGEEVESCGGCQFCLKIVHLVLQCLHLALRSRELGLEAIPLCRHGG